MVYGGFRFQLVTFDITGTLLKFREPISSTYSRIASAHGIKVEPNRLNAVLKNNWMRMDKEYPNFGLGTKVTWKRWWSDLVMQSIQDASMNDKEPNSSVSDASLNKITQRLIEMYATMDCWEVSDGAVDLLTFLKAQKVVLAPERRSCELNERPVVIGAISNFDPRLENLMFLSGLRPYFDFVLTSYKFGHLKPDVRIFAKALEQGSVLAGYTIPPESALHIGNSVETDVVGAKHAGWSSYLVGSQSGDCSVGVEPDKCFGTLREVQTSLSLGS